VPGSNHPQYRAFGMPLEFYCEQDRVVVPIIVTMCVKELENRRATFSSDVLVHLGNEEDAIDKLQGYFTNVGISYEYIGTNLESENINVILGLLDRYFRSLPTPVLGSDLITALINDAPIAGNIHAIEMFKSNLPPCHQNTLNTLLNFMAKVYSPDMDPPMSSGITYLVKRLAPGMVMGTMSTDGHADALLAEPAINVMTTIWMDMAFKIVHHLSNRNMPSIIG